MSTVISKYLPWKRKPVSSHWQRSKRCFSGCWFHFILTITLSLRILSNDVGGRFRLELKSVKKPRRSEAEKTPRFRVRRGTKNKVFDLTCTLSAVTRDLCKKREKSAKQIPHRISNGFLNIFCKFCWHDWQIWIIFLNSKKEVDRCLGWLHRTNCWICTGVFQIIGFENTLFSLYLSIFEFSASQPGKR